MIVVAPEDGIEDVFRPRLREAGADLDRVTFVLSRTEGDDEENVVLPRDLPLLTEVVRDTDAVLVWIDSLVTTMPESVKTISYKDVNGVIKPLGQWADAQRVAVAAPWHLNKAAGTDTALRMMDSRAFRTAVRSLLLVVEDPNAPEGKRAGIVALDKVNAGPSDVPALRFTVRAAHYTVTEPDRKTGKPREFPASCAVVDWAGEVDGDGRALARGLLAPRVEQEGTARQWLRQYLTVNGETARPQVIEDAEAAGHKRTAITNAAQALRVHSREEKGQTDGRPWRRAYWSLPESSAAVVHTQTTRTTGTTGETQQRTSESIPQVSSSGPSHPSRP